ncbi:MAG: N-glycosylase/DNA lyase [Nitrospirae bacterium]|nr:N-glycosylase/DNA lyase [Nitrospirota bacterium]
MSNIKELQKDHKLKKKEIKNRLREFQETWEKGDEAIFKELCFCILTANASAQMGINCINNLGDLLLKGSIKDMKDLRCGGHRFPNKRSEFIIHTREYINRALGFRLKEKIEFLKDFYERRDFFAKNPGIKGLGYKEASHFLRNIGFRGYAILDKHILRSLHEFGVIKDIEKPNTKKKYMDIENKMKSFSNKINIDMDELDLLLWSRKTGKILK